MSLCHSLFSSSAFSNTTGVAGLLPVGWSTSYQVDKVKKARRPTTFQTPLALCEKHSTQSMTSAFCFLLGNTHGVPSVIQVHQVRPLKNTLIHSVTCFCGSGKHFTLSMTSAFCFLLGNTHGVPSVIQVHQVRPLKNTLIHSVTCFCGSAHWKYHLTHTAKTAVTA